MSAQRGSSSSRGRGFLGKVHHTIATAITITTTISRYTQPTRSSPSPSRLRPLWSIAAGASLAALLAACAGAPPDDRAAATALICPPAPQPSCPAPEATAAPPEHGRLRPAAWSDLPSWTREPLRPALDAFVRGCQALEQRPAWKAACRSARALAPAATPAQLATFFEATFDPHQVLNADGSDVGMVTGYYEPLLHGSRTASPRFRFPLYGVPPDLLVVDLASVHPELRHRRLRGRLEGNRVVPYLARGAIDGAGAPLRGNEIAWVDDAVDAFFLHIQGSGQVELDNGTRIRLGYADHNGHPFRSLGAQLIRAGEIPRERASMQGIREWARRHPQRLREFLDTNPSYVFFRELPSELPGPLGALGVPLTPGHSIAVDRRVIPLGAPVFLATSRPDSAEPLQRLVVAQDTGGAITGAVRADFFWGFGDAAGALAGRMRQAGRMWVLLPKGYALPAAGS